MFAATAEVAMPEDHQGTEPAPRLLSGGNPQIPKGDGEGPVQAYIDAMPDWKGDVGRHLDRLVRAVVPDARRAVRWNSPFWGSDDGWFLSVHCLTRAVKVTFFDGVSLDPQPPVATKDGRARCVNIATEAEIDDERFTAWLRQAAELPGWDGF